MDDVDLSEDFSQADDEAPIQVQQHERYDIHTLYIVYKARDN